MIYNTFVLQPQPAGSRIHTVMQKKKKKTTRDDCVWFMERSDTHTVKRLLIKVSDKQRQEPDTFDLYLGGYQPLQWVDRLETNDKQ